MRLTKWSRAHSYLRISPHFMEIKGSIPCSEEPATCFYSETYQSILRPPAYFFRICEYVNIHPSTPTSYKLSLSFWFPAQNSTCIYTQTWLHFDIYTVVLFVCNVATSVELCRYCFTVLERDSDPHSSLLHYM